MVSRRPVVIGRLSPCESDCVVLSSREAGPRRVPRTETRTSVLDSECRRRQGIEAGLDWWRDLSRTAARLKGKRRRKTIKPRQGPPFRASCTSQGSRSDPTRDPPCHPCVVPHSLSRVPTRVSTRSPDRSPDTGGGRGGESSLGSATLRTRDPNDHGRKTIVDGCTRGLGPSLPEGSSLLPGGRVGVFGVTDTQSSSPVPARETPSHPHPLQGSRQMVPFYKIVSSSSNFFLGMVLGDCTGPYGR